MNISRIYMEGFGKYLDTELRFEPGINLIHGKNESGKSTIHSFMEAMLLSMNDYEMEIGSHNEKFRQYRPWAKPDVFAGEMDYMESGTNFHLKRNFSDDDDGMYVELDGVPVEREELSRMEELSDQLTNSRLLGITDVSKKTGIKLVDEMKSRIINIRNTGNGLISFEDTLFELRERKSAIENDEELFQLNKDLEYYHQKMIEVEAQQEVKKEYIRKYFIKLQAANHLKQEIDLLEKNVTRYEQIEVLRKYDTLKKLNDEIISITDMVVQLEGFQEVNMSEVESYLDAKKEVSSIEDKLKEVEQSLKNMKDQQSDIEADIPLSVLEGLSDRAYAEAFMSKYRKLVDFKTELFEVEKKITETEELLADEEERIYGKDEVLAKIEKLTKDYYKFWLSIDRKKQIDEELEVSDMESAKKAMKKLEDKRMNLRIAILICQILIAGGIILLGINISLYLLSALMIVVGIIGWIALYVLFKRVREDIDDQSYMMKRQEEEVEKNAARLQQVNDSIENTLKLYDCSSPEAFEQLYNIRKEAYDNDLENCRILADLRSKRTSLQNKMKKVKPDVEECIKLVKIDATNIKLITENGFDVLKETVKRSEMHHELAGRINEYSNSIFGLNRNLEDAKKVVANPVLDALEISSISDYQEKRESWVRSNENLTRLLGEKTELLGNDKEEEIYRLGDEFSQLGLTDVFEFDFNFEKARDMLNNKKAEYSTVSTECEEAKTKADEIGNSMMVHSAIGQNIEDINEQIAVYTAELESYDEVIDTLMTASVKIAEIYKSELMGNIQKVVNDVVGGKYEINIDENADLTVKDVKTEKTVDISDLSLGTIDQIYFAVRIALIDTMSTGGSIPLILDDVFVHYDGQRLAHMLQKISNLGRQVIMMTCHDREKETFEMLNIPVNNIEI